MVGGEECRLPGTPKPPKTAQQAVGIWPGAAKLRSGGRSSSRPTCRNVCGREEQGVEGPVI